MNWVLESMSSSLKTLAARVLVVLASARMPSTCCPTSCVRARSFCENSCRYRRKPASAARFHWPPAAARSSASVHGRSQDYARQ